MRWGKPIKKDRRIDPRYFLNETVEEEHALEEGCTDKEHIEEDDLYEEKENPGKGKDLKFELRKAYLMAQRMGKEEQAAKYLSALKNLHARELKNKGESY